MQDFEAVRREDLTPLLEKMPAEMRREIDIKTERLVRKLAQLKIGSNTSSPPDGE